jgi:hypothetical protein
MSPESRFSRYLADYLANGHLWGREHTYPVDQGSSLPAKPSATAALAGWTRPRWRAADTVAASAAVCRPNQLIRAVEAGGALVDSVFRHFLACCVFLSVLSLRRQSPTDLSTLPMLAQYSWPRSHCAGVGLL